MQEESSLEELRTAVKSELERKGVLRELRARLMAEILYSLSEENDENEGGSNGISEENLVLNSLIYDYLMYNGYQGTGAVLLKEAKMDSSEEMGKGNQVLSGEELRKILKVEEGGNLPLLYSFIK
ncbi:LisH domain-containing protein FOPNL [Cryptosporidium felis]|nr:LisH domain-containing protein FOPNL [Cryptosporidium felis]